MTLSYFWMLIYLIETFPDKIGSNRLLNSLQHKEMMSDLLCLVMSCIYCDYVAVIVTMED